MTNPTFLDFLPMSFLPASIKAVNDVYQAAYEEGRRSRDAEVARLVKIIDGLSPDNDDGPFTQEQDDRLNYPRRGQAKDLNRA